MDVTESVVSPAVEEIPEEPVEAKPRRMRKEIRQSQWHLAEDQAIEEISHWRENLHQKFSR